MICPICKSNLMKFKDLKSYKCENNHSFDVAKQGYVNLLPVSEKNSKSPGDSKDMVTARREFLSKGYYQKVSDEICRLAGDYGKLKAKSEKIFSLLDLGCGEGYYTTNILNHLNSNGISSRIIGLDISKDAVKHASTINKDITWIVANNYSVPLENDSMDCVISVFSPIKIEELSRILKSEGCFIRALPGKNHLIELRKMIYDEVIDTDDTMFEVDAPNMKYMSTVDVNYTISLNKDEAVSLIKMTPHYWHTSKKNKESLNEIEAISVTVHMKLLVFKKIN